MTLATAEESCRLRMEAGVPPLAEVNLLEDTRLAGHPRVDVVVGEDHCVYLHAVHLVAVLAEDAGEFHFANLVQLLQGEGARPPAVLVPMTIAKPGRRIS